MNTKYMHPADRLVAMMNRIYYKGLTTTSGGNLSMTDSEGNIWITPTSVDKGRLTREDIVRVAPDGSVHGKNKPSVELPFHRMVMQTTGKNAVLHAHPPALVTVSLLRKGPDIDTLSAFHQYVKKLGMSAYDLPGSLKLGEKIAAVFREGADAVMMENHGIVVNADTLEEAFIKFESMEAAAELTIETTRLGKVRHITAKDRKALSAAVKAETKPGKFAEAMTPGEVDLRNELAAFTVRSAKQKLFRSFDGVYAARLSGDTFLIGADTIDREELTAEDVSKVSGLTAEGTPSAFAGIFRRVFEKHPEVGAVSAASPIAAMAFGVTGRELDSRTIPESYLMMRNVFRMTLSEFLKDPETVSDKLCLSTPVVLVDNAFVLTAGVNLTKCFDSLEVTEFTAKTILNAERLKGYGDIVKITPEQVEEINVAFHLN